MLGGVGVGAPPGVSTCVIWYSLIRLLPGPPKVLSQNRRYLRASAQLPTDPSTKLGHATRPNPTLRTQPRNTPPSPNPLAKWPTAAHLARNDNAPRQLTAGRFRLLHLAEMAPRFVPKSELWEREQRPDRMASAKYSHGTNLIVGIE